MADSVVWWRGDGARSMGGEVEFLDALELFNDDSGVDDTHCGSCLYGVM